MKYLLLLAFLIPSFSFALGNLNINGGTYGTTTPSIPILISGFDNSGTGSNGPRYRVYAPGGYVSGITDNPITTWAGHFDGNDIFFKFNLYGKTNGNACLFMCSAIGRWTVVEYTTSVSTVTNDIVYIDVVQDKLTPIDFQNYFTILFLVGALLFILRPVIKKLTLSS